MTKLHAEKGTDPTLHLLGRILISLVLWGATFLAASWILESDPPGVMIRGAAVALAVAGIVPWIWMASRAIVAEDEFTRRIHFIALSWAFAATGVFVFAADLLVRAHFIDDLPILNVWLFMIAVWWVSLMLTRRHYR